jgi:hypothetical protein
MSVRHSLFTWIIIPCDIICQWLATSRWFSPGTPVSSTNKTDRHDITEILLKVGFNTINQPTNPLCATNPESYQVKWKTNICRISRDFTKPIYLIGTDISINYTLYKNAGFWLVNSRDIFFTNSVLALWICSTSCMCICIRFNFFHGICLIVFAVFTLHRDACNTICKTLSVVRFM